MCIDPSEFPVRNHIFARLGPGARDFVAARWQTRALTLGEVIYRPGEEFTHAVFPHAGVISLLSAEQAERSVEKASIGNEGFLGFTYLLGGGDALSLATVQVPGYASWLARADLDEATERFDCIRLVMLRYAKALIVQLMESVGCNSLHSAEQRVSRWLLHAHDRMDEAPFQLKQEALAQVLALRRATVSEVCSNLQRSGAIHYARGQLTVLDRDLLRQHACGCYDRIVAMRLAEGPDGEQSG